MTFLKLDNVIQNYSWGSRTSINEMFNVPNPSNQPQAEIWMGAHRGGCSKIIETGELLSDVINMDKLGTLGDVVVKRFNELPFLFKVLAAEKPLSIQVHPNKYKSELGFARENKLGISLDAHNRSYKDPNHKPELVYALTAYKAMNGFRPIKHILALFDELGLVSLENEVNALRESPTSLGLKIFFSSIMNLHLNYKDSVLTELENIEESQLESVMVKDALSYSKIFAQHYPGDIGLLSPFILNTIELQAGEAMFLFPETPHAYVKGTALEVMASSDNVLRAGLTEKYINLEELFDNIIFEPTELDNLRIRPSLRSNRLVYPIPVDDFGFEIIDLFAISVCEISTTSVEILFCIEGCIQIHNDNYSMVLEKGESVFIRCDVINYKLFGSGRLGRAYAGV